MKDILLITAGTLLFGAGVGLFLDPNNLAPGGATGIAIILNRLTSIQTGTLILLINIPILLLGFFKFGAKFLASTFYATIMTSMATNFFEHFEPLSKDPMLSAIYGGAVMAVGVACVFKAGATTGGTDVIVKVIRQKHPQIKTGRVFLMIDLCITALSAVFFKNISVMLYAALAVFVSSIVVDLVLYGTDEAKLIYIISDNSARIASKLMEELDVGVTFLEGEGAYSNKSKKVIMCVMRKQTAPKAEEVIKAEDPEAFMIITKATEIYGQGYKNIFHEKI